jgi:CHAD domain-containing protein
MERVLKEMDDVRTAPEPDAVHDLRVALRRCRSLAAVMEEVDPHPAWPQMRRLGRKLFRQLGELRDTQVLEEWVHKLGSDGDPVRTRAQSELGKIEADEKQAALRAAAKFDQKAWKGYERTLGRRVRVIAPDGPAAQSLALERLLAAKELHLQALRTEKPEPWHALRIGVKRFRYTVESLMPQRYAIWGETLKRVQDLLGEVHDLDVLAETIARLVPEASEQVQAAWRERIASERSTRLGEYRELCMGTKRLWQEWREGLPQGRQQESAAMSRLRATARALGAAGGKSAQVSRLAMKLYNGLRKANAGAPFAALETRKVMQAAARLHGIGAGLRAKPPQKAARKFLQNLAMPAGWNEAEWELLGLAVRYHRGKVPRAKDKAYARLGKDEQKTLCAMAGVLRLARELRKHGVNSAKDLEVERSVDAVIVRAPGLENTETSAARIAAGKHLLETVLDRPLIVQPAPILAKVVELPKAPDPIQAAASD